MDPGTIIDGKYEIVRTIGVGGFGAVYEAMQAKLNRRVAIKILNLSVLQEADGLARFEQEAKAINALKHKNIVGFYGYGVWQGAPYMVMEYIEGNSLHDNIVGFRKLEALRALRIFRQMLEALSCAHAAGVVHRDLKPTNVMISTDPNGVEHVKIIDFGLARLMPGYGMSAQKLTETGMMVGTCHYMAPEQALGQPVDQRADIYGAGCMLYHMLAGVPPFDADAAIAIAHMHLAEQAPPLDGQSENVQTLVKNCMNKSAEKRYQNCNEVIADVDATLKGKSTINLLAGTDQTLIEKPRRRARLPKVAWFAACASILLACGSAAIYFNLRSSDVVTTAGHGRDYSLESRQAQTEDQREGHGQYRRQMNLWKNRMAYGASSWPAFKRHASALDVLRYHIFAPRITNSMTDGAELAHEYLTTADTISDEGDFVSFDKSRRNLMKSRIAALDGYYKLKHGDVPDAEKVKIYSLLCRYYEDLLTPDDHVQSPPVMQAEAKSYLDQSLALRAKLADGRTIVSDAEVFENIRRLGDEARFSKYCDDTIAKPDATDRAVVDLALFAKAERAKSFQEAERYLNEAIKSGDPGSKPEARYQLAVQCMAARKVAQGKALVEANLNDENIQGMVRPNSRMLLARMFLDEKNYSKADAIATEAEEELYQAVHADYRTPPPQLWMCSHARLIRIIALSIEGKTSKAQRLYEEFLRYARQEDVETGEAKLAEQLLAEATAHPTAKVNDRQ